MSWITSRKSGTHLRSSLSGFYNQMDHLIVFNSGNYTNFNARTKGLELALEGSWADGIRGRASYSLQYTRNDSVGWQMPDSPNHMVKLNLSVPLVKDKAFRGRGIPIHERPAIAPQYHRLQAGSR